jgi:hypothetical protein
MCSWLCTNFHTTHPSSYSRHWTFLIDLDPNKSLASQVEEDNADRMFDKGIYDSKSSMENFVIASATNKSNEERNPKQPEKSSIGEALLVHQPPIADKSEVSSIVGQKRKSGEPVIPSKTKALEGLLPKCASAINNNDKMAQPNQRNGAFETANQALEKDRKDPPGEDMKPVKEEESDPHLKEKGVKSFKVRERSQQFTSSFVAPIHSHSNEFPTIFLIKLD